MVYVDYFARCATAVRDFLPAQYEAFQRLDRTCAQVSGGAYGIYCVSALLALLLG